MNDLLITFREKGKKKGFTFNEKNLKEENIPVNLELQDFIKLNREAQEFIEKLKTNNMSLKRQKEILINSVSNEDKNKVNMVIQEIITQNTDYQSNIKMRLMKNYVNFIKDIDDNGKFSWSNSKKFSRCDDSISIFGVRTKNN